MRLATWNCCQQFATNLPHLLGLDVDVAVVCEAQALPSWPPTASGRAVTGASRPVGDANQKHLAVIACDPWRVHPHPEASSAPPWTLPVVIDGPVSFTCVGLWPVRKSGWPGYVEQVDLAAQWAEKRVSREAVVVAGDFNAPIADSLGRYVQVVDRFAEMGLVDAYQRVRGLDPADPAPEPTYYHRPLGNRPFHIDHMMLPSDWARGATVTVGDFDTWVASGRSDHVPVVVDVATPRPETGVSQTRPK